MARLNQFGAVFSSTLLGWFFFGQLTTCSFAHPVGIANKGEPPLRVFLVAGQSNAEGADTHASEIDGYPPFVGAGAPQSDATIWYELGGAGGYSSNGWIPMQPATQTKIFGPELTFARSVTEQVSTQFAIIKSAKGGTNLAVDWDPGNLAGAQMYNRTISLVQMALADLTNSGVEWVLEGVLWQQGENDMLDDRYVTQYGSRLTALRSGEFSPGELAVRLNVPKTRIYHHVNVLERLNIIEQTREVRRRGAVERFFIARKSQFVVAELKTQDTREFFLGALEAGSREIRERLDVERAAGADDFVYFTGSTRIRASDEALRELTLFFANWVKRQRAAQWDGPETHLAMVTFPLTEEAEEAE